MAKTYRELQVEDFIRTGKKPLDAKMIRIKNKDGTIVSVFPLDKEAQGFYFSKADGFVPPDAACTDFVNQALHYGEAGFEGVRAYYTRYGTAFPQLHANVARLIWSSLEFDGRLEKDVLTMAKNMGETNRFIFETMTAARLFASGKKAIENDELLCVGSGYALIDTGVTKLRTGSTEFRYGLMADKGGPLHQYTPLELDTLVKMMAFINRIASTDHCPEHLEMALSAYFRPHFWVSGEKGLKVSSIGKPLYLAIETLPWGVYLKEEDYTKGIDALVAPNRRIGEDMAPDRKIAANYVNSNKNGKYGNLLGYGEILSAKDDAANIMDRHYVEGSAENMFVIFERGDGFVAYTPPVGDGCLPGTTRHRVIETLHRIGVDVRFESLPLRDIVKSKGVLFTGTGAQLIHLRSITVMPELENAKKAFALRSEDDPVSGVCISDLQKGKMEFLINGGVKSDIVAHIQDEYGKTLLRCDMLDPAYSISLKALGGIMGAEPREIFRNAGLPDPGLTMESLDEMLNPKRYGKGMPAHDDNMGADIMQRTTYAAMLIASALRIREKETGKPQIRRAIRKW
ncbi:MAG: aminotransferase class IV [Candidatus Bilamarchaeaceae archaeon]